jgi:hypothetical protein
MRRILMCQTIPPPPPDVEAELPEPGDDTPMTKRELLELHVSDPLCASCHQFTDPIGLALEHYDALGGYRLTDQGLPIDPSGDLDGKPFPDAIALGGLLHRAHRRRRLRRPQPLPLRHRPRRADPALAPVITLLRDSLVDSGYDLTAAVDALVRSEGFRYATRSPEDLP